MSDFREVLKRRATAIEAELTRLLEERRSTFPEVLYDSSAYSLMAGGKRLRPAMSLEVCAMLGGDEAECLPSACALEMIHTATLIHDDLPCMDNDDYRRGKLTNHKVFGEACAVLTGMELFNLGYDVIVKNAEAHPEHAVRHLKALSALLTYMGEDGVIGGQTVDVLFEHKLDTEKLDYIHKRKTAALFTAALLQGAYISGATETDVNMLKQYGLHMGMAFQIADDILDVVGDEKTLGKPIGSDAASGKLTFVSAYGLDGARQKLKEAADRAKAAIEPYGERAEFLRSLIDFTAERNN